MGCTCSPHPYRHVTEPSACAPACLTSAAPHTLSMNHGFRNAYRSASTPTLAQARAQCAALPVASCEPLHSSVFTERRHRLASPRGGRSSFPAPMTRARSKTLSKLETNAGRPHADLQTGPIHRGFCIPYSSRSQKTTPLQTPHFPASFLGKYRIMNSEMT